MDMSVSLSPALKSPDLKVKIHAVTCTLCTVSVPEPALGWFPLHVGLGLVVEEFKMTNISIASNI